MGHSRAPRHLMAVCLMIAVASQVKAEPGVPVTGDTAVVSIDNLPGCAKPDDVRLILDMLRADDYEAMDAAMRKHARDGTCGLFSKGDSVRVLEIDIDEAGTLARVRAKGSPQALWTLQKALTVR